MTVDLRPSACDRRRRFQLLAAVLFTSLAGCAPDEPMFIGPPASARESVARTATLAPTEFHSSLTVYGSPWTGASNWPDSQQYEVDLARSSGDRVTVDLRSWARPIGESRRATPVSVTLGPEPYAQHRLSDGRLVSVSLTDTTIARILASPPRLWHDPNRPPLSNRLKQASPKSAETLPLLAPIEHYVTSAIAARTRDILRARWTSEERIDDKRTRFSAQRNGQTIAVLFDEHIGAIVQEELHESDGSSAVTRFVYVREGVGHRLVEREQTAKTSRGEFRFKERFHAQSNVGGVR